MKHGRRRYLGAAFEVQLTSMTRLYVTPVGTQPPKELRYGDIWLDWAAWEAMQSFALAVDSRERGSQTFDRLMGPAGKHGRDETEQELVAISAALDAARAFSARPAKGRARHAR